MLQMNVFGNKINEMVDKFSNQMTKLFIISIFTFLCNYSIQPFNMFDRLLIDHMHMTSQKGAHVRWGSNEALPRASSPSMQPGGQTLQATPPGWPARARALTG